MTGSTCGRSQRRGPRILRTLCWREPPGPLFFPSCDAHTHTHKARGAASLATYAHPAARQHPEASCSALGGRGVSRRRPGRVPECEHVCAGSGRSAAVRQLLLAHYNATCRACWAEGTPRRFAHPAASTMCSSLLRWSLKPLSAAVLAPVPARAHTLGNSYSFTAPGRVLPQRGARHPALRALLALRGHGGKVLSRPCEKFNGPLPVGDFWHHRGCAWPRWARSRTLAVPRIQASLREAQRKLLRLSPAYCPPTPVTLSVQRRGPEVAEKRNSVGRALISSAPLRTWAGGARHTNSK